MSTADISVPRLSICIATFNRAKVICETLDSITAQLPDGVELLIVDGASTDDTESVLDDYCKLHAGVRYIREPVNSGVDADFDKAVSYARGDYCWLMTDDDLLKQGAIQRVLDEIASEPELLVVDAEVWNTDFTRLLQPSRMYLSEDQYFSETSSDFLALAGDALSFIAAVVIRREAWQVRTMKPYYGSLFVHCGAILQAPALKGVKVLADPLIQIRYGNAMWTPRSFEIWMFLWPNLIWGFPGYSEDAKRLVSPREPWRSGMNLFKYRAKGGYSLAEYRGYIRSRASGMDSLRAISIALLPAAVANFLAVAFVVTLSRQSRLGLSDLLSSPHAGRASRALARLVPLRELDS